MLFIGVSRYQQQSSINTAMDNLTSCVSYCMDEITCRRVLLLKYFGEQFPSTQCNNTCDTCKNSKSLQFTDFTADGM